MKKITSLILAVAIIIPALYMFETGASAVGIRTVTTNMNTLEVSGETYPPENAIDGNTATCFWSFGAPKDGSYIMVDLGRVAEIISVRVLMDDLAYIQDAVIEYSADGSSFTQLCSTTGAVTNYDQRFSARYVCMRSTSDETKYFVKIFEFEINCRDAFSNMAQADENYAYNAFDGNKDTFFLSQKPVSAGDYLCVDMGQIQTVDSIHLVMDRLNYIKQGVIEYSSDGVNFTKLCDTNREEIWNESVYKARYIRIRATADNPTAAKIFEFEVGGKSFISTFSAYGEYVIENAIDGDHSTYFMGRGAPKSGSYFGIDLGKVSYITSLRLLTQPGGYFESAVIEYSPDGVNYTNLCSANTADTQYEDQPFSARFVRVRANADQTTWIMIREFEINLNNFGIGMAYTTMTQNNGYAAGYALDHDPNTYFAAARKPNTGNSFTVDLGKPYLISKVYVHTYGFPTGVLEYSMDGVNYFELGSMASSGKTVTGKFAARYVRARVTASAAFGKATRFYDFDIDTVCEYEISLVNVTLQTGGKMDINYKVRKEITEYNTVYMTFNGSNDHIGYSQSGDYSVFTYSDIKPEQMNDDITAALHSVYEGSDSTVSVNYNIVDYCESAISTSPSALNRLLVDMLNYGAAAQAYAGSTAEPANASLTQAQKALGTQTEPFLTDNYSLQKLDNASVKWKNVGLRLEEDIAIRYTFTVPDEVAASNPTIRFTNASNNAIIEQVTLDKCESMGGGTYKYYLELPVNMMRTVVEAAVCSDSTKISSTLEYSIVSYAARQISRLSGSSNANDKALVDLLKAMIKYGDSAASYTVG